MVVFTFIRFISFMTPNRLVLLQGDLIMSGRGLVLSDVQNKNFWPPFFPDPELLPGSKPKAGRSTIQPRMQQYLCQRFVVLSFSSA
jgi:hypothetical protein